MVHTKKDRSIVITKPNGTILCSCPVQPNNTWIFPRQLMTGNLSPATAVPIGISGTPGATVLPLSCTACTIGKLYNADLHTTSLSAPSTTVGQCIFFDFQLLTTPSVGGNTQAIIAIDDRSGFLSVFGSKFKDHHDVMIPIEQLIATYNSRGHQVTALCSDSEAICRSLGTPLGLLHVHITHTTPDAHCHKVERATRKPPQS